MDQSEKILRSYIRESLISADNDALYEVVYRGEAGGFAYQSIHPLVYQAARTAKYLGRTALGAVGSLGRFVRRNAGALTAAAISGGLAYLVAGPEGLLKIGTKIRNGVMDIFTDERKKEAIGKLLPPAEEIDPVFLTGFVNTLIAIEKDESDPPTYTCVDLEDEFLSDMQGLSGEIARIKSATGRDKIVLLWNAYTDVELVDLDDAKYAEITEDLDQEEIDIAVERFIAEANSNLADVARDMLTRSKSRNARICETKMSSAFQTFKTMR